MLAPGVQAPPLVCLQFKVDDSPEQLIHVRDPACRRTIVWALENAGWAGHHLAHELVTVMAQWQDLTEPIFDLLDRNLATCTIVRQKLLDIAAGNFKAVSKKRGYALDAVGRLYGVEVNKEDPWRLRYGTLYGVPVSQWPHDAVHYALADARAHHGVFVGQEARRYNAQGLDLFADQFRQTWASVWMKLMECWGIRTDPARVEQYIETVRETLEADREVCQEHGLVRADGSKDTKEAAARMLRICREAEEPDFPVTEKGELAVRQALGLPAKEPLPVGATWRALQRGPVAVRLDEDACRDFGDEVLEAYQRYGTSTSQISRAERLRHGLIQARFGSLQETGRTSCSQGDGKKGKGPGFASAHGAQLQNPAKDKKIPRKCPPGWVRDGKFFVDPLTGERRPAVVERKGTRECYIARPGYVFCSSDYGGMELAGFAQVCIWTVRFSRLAEVINAGKDPHLTLAATLACVSEAEAIARYNGERGPELQQEMDSRYRQLAKIANFGFQGGMGHKKLRIQAKKQHGVILTIEEAYALRQAWLRTWPEANAYFEWVKSRLHGPRDNQTGTFVQFKSGRVRGRCWYSAAANTLFQGLCADIAKESCKRVTREMYLGKRYDNGQPSPLFGSRRVNFLHDEDFLEMPEERAHEAAQRLAETMVKTAEEWAPDLKWKAAPALMRRWYKSAKPVYENGKLVPWEPKAA